MNEDDVVETGDASSAAEEGSVDPLPPGPPRSETATDPAPTYRVSLNCPTPLVQKVVECTATDEEDAKRIFNLANGISSSIHTYKVEQL